MKRFITILGFLLAAGSAAAQDSNIILPAALIEKRLTQDSFTVADIRGSRRPNDRTSRAALSWASDSIVLVVKFAPAPEGGHIFNNAPRYEVAAYELQKMFLDDVDYVVPPTVFRVFDVEWYQKLSPNIKPTFKEAQSVVAVLQYWLSGVTPDSAYNPDRLKRDSVYARHFGDLNILTYLIKHGDANVGNVLVSQFDHNPRVFAVDNGVSFHSVESDRGTIWRDLLVNRLPRATIERLQKITRADLDRTLSVLVEYEIRDGRLVPVEKSENFSRNRGVRRKDNRIQFGLTAAEIAGVQTRLQELLRMVRGGAIKTF